MPTTSSPKSDAAALLLDGTTRRQNTSRVQTDWVVVLLPAALAILTFSAAASLLALGLLSFVALIRKAQSRRSIQPGPFVLLVTSAVIVLTRYENNYLLFVFILLTFLVIRLVITVDARVLIASLIDGAGLYLVLNVLTYTAGLRSPSGADRIGGYVESSGFVRIIYPLSGSLEVAPSVASVYIAAAAFLIFERGWMRRYFRLACLIAAFVVVWQGGARTSLFAAITIPVVVICFPFITRWLAQAVTLFASISIFLLPSLFSSVQSIAIPFLSFIAPDRDFRAVSVSSLNGRDLIWDRSLNYWMNRIDGTFRPLLGFGQQGQYRSGASMSYADLLAGTVRHPERASVHNSFLQQLFDGGLVGWLLMTLAIFWACVRLSRHRRDWAPQGVAAIVAVVALLINAMTQVSIAPGATQASFWLLVVLVGVACQSGSCEENAERGASGRQTNALRTWEPVEPAGRQHQADISADTQHSQPPAHSDPAPIAPRE
jgi:hypothetical protein